MFDLPGAKEPLASASVAGRRTFQTILDAVAAVQAAGGLPAGDPLPLAVVAWTGVNGLAKLAIAAACRLTQNKRLDFTGYLTRALSAGIRSLPHLYSFEPHGSWGKRESVFSRDPYRMRKLSFRPTTVSQQSQGNGAVDASNNPASGGGEILPFELTRILMIPEF
jgi:WHG domain-containing protein